MPQYAKIMYKQNSPPTRTIFLLSSTRRPRNICLLFSADRDELGHNIHWNILVTFENPHIKGKWGLYWLSVSCLWKENNIAVEQPWQTKSNAVLSVDCDIYFDKHMSYIVNFINHSNTSLKLSFSNNLDPTLFTLIMHQTV